MNSPPAVIGTTVESAAQVISSWGFVITPELLTQTAQDVGELSILSRAGGAPTLAVGMANIMASLFGGKAMMAFWYHFAILFEALFILTAIDAGTRVGRFMIQDLLGTFYAPLKQTRSWASNLIATTLCVGAWGYFLYQGVVDPLGGINTLWPLFGISNQMLAAIALTLGTVVLFKMKRERYAWVTIVPTIWLVICTLTAGLQKLFHPDPKISFLASAQRFSDALAQGQILAPAKSIAEMQRIIVNNYVDAGLSALFVAVVAAMVGYGLVAAWRGYVTPHITAREAPAYV
jgi:carbon starvation protein